MSLAFLSPKSEFGDLECHLFKGIVYICPGGRQGPIPLPSDLHRGQGQQQQQQELNTDQINPVAADQQAVEHINPLPPEEMPVQQTEAVTVQTLPQTYLNVKYIPMMP